MKNKGSVVGALLAVLATLDYAQIIVVLPPAWKQYAPYVTFFGVLMAAVSGPIGDAFSKPTAKKNPRRRKADKVLVADPVVPTHITSAQAVVDRLVEES